MITSALSGVTGVVGSRTWPFPLDDVYMALVRAKKPVFLRPISRGEGRHGTECSGGAKLGGF